MTAGTAHKVPNVDNFHVLAADVQLLVTTAQRIRQGVADANRASRNLIALQTNEEWLRAYDAANLTHEHKESGESR